MNGISFHVPIKMPLPESVLLDSVLTTVMVVSSAYVVEKKGPPCVI